MADSACPHCGSTPLRTFARVQVGGEAKLSLDKELLIGDVVHEKLVKMTCLDCNTELATDDIAGWNFAHPPYGMRLQLLQVAERFLRRKASIGELRNTVRAVRIS